jgi:c-di-GMP-binding flagellar brake protein YcgR
MSSSRISEEEDQRRRHYRVAVTLALRLREAEERPERHDEVASFEELSVAAARYRKELPGPGRTFVDRLMRTLDALTSELAERRGSAGWCPRLVVNGNLSAGGLGFGWESYQAPGTKLDLEFSINDVESNVPFHVRAMVVRCEANEEDGFEVGVEFSNLPAATQQRLVRVLLDLQRVQLRTRTTRR